VHPAVPPNRGSGPAYARIRELRLALPETSEKQSHGEASWFVGKRSFVTSADRHHDDRRAVWLAAPAGAQEVLVASGPDRFFGPPFVGHRGWIGVYLDVTVDWDELAALVRDAWAMVATDRIRSKLD
jgi:hypothetical protein